MNNHVGIVAKLFEELFVDFRTCRSRLSHGFVPFIHNGRFGVDTAEMWLEFALPSIAVMAGGMIVFTWVLPPRRPAGPGGPPGGAGGGSAGPRGGPGRGGGRGGGGRGPGRRGGGRPGGGG